ncbi:hypothetical protein HYR99_13305 [Candidatus Poribacteria bacterium]|nr:hypothetical protein [Candidatus Poribacteria bacterium]
MIIPEDFRKDRYTLEPIIKEMMTAVGKQKTKVVACTDPLLGGIDQALRWERIREIIDDYKHKVQLFLLCMDRDGKAERRARIDYLEEQASSILNQNQRFLGENAWQEIEVWVLAGHDLPDAWSWSEIRQEINPKETYFVPFIKHRGLQNQPGGGRKILAEEAARRYNRIRQLCPEDVANLEGRISAWIKTEPGE